MALNFKRSLIATAENEVRVFNEQMNTIKNYTDDRKILLGNVVKPGEMLVSSDHKFLFVISQEKSLVIFDIAQKTIETQIDHVGGVKCISEEKGILAIGGIKSLSFYSTEDFSLKHSIPITQECRGVSISSDASWAASIHKDGKLQK